MAFTKIVGAGIHTLSNVHTHNIKSSGIITATSFVGPMENSSGISTFYDLKVTNNLTVEGTTTTLDTNLIGVDRIAVGASSNTIVGVAITQSGTADILNLYDGGTNVLTVDDEGNVGVGTDTPTQKLDVRADGFTKAVFKGTGASADNVGLFINSGNNASQIANAVGSTGETIIFNSNDNAMIFETADTEALRIASDGDVGIGTNNPHSELEVYDAEFADITIGSGRTASNIGGLNFRKTDPGGAPAGIMTAQYFVNTSGSHFFHSQGTERLQIKSNGQTVMTSNQNQPLVLNNTNTNGQSSISFQSAGSTKYNVGSNKENDGNIDFFIYDQVNNKHRFNIKADGSVGIGTPDPQTELHVQSPNDTLVRVTSADGNAAYLELGDVSDPDGGKIVYDSGDNLELYTASEPRLRIDSNGVICVNHTNALHSGKLQVSTTGADAIDINSYSTSADNGGRLSFYRSKNATIGSNTIVADDDSLGRIDFRGYNTSGNSYNQGATIEARVDGSVNSSTDMPTRLEFKTSQDGSASPTERLRIDSDGQIGIGNIVPDTWSTGHGLTIGTSQATLWGVADQVNLSGNAYFNSEWKAAATKAGASQIQQALGQIDLRVTGSVSADAAITWIDALSIAKTGVITAQKSATFGNTSDSFTSLTITADATSGISELRFADTTANAGYVKYQHSDNVLILATDTTERVRINESGNVNVGVGQTIADLRYLDVQNTAIGASSGAILRLITAQSDETGTTSADIVKYKSGGLFIKNNENNGNTGFISLQTATAGYGTSERLRITSDGKLAFNYDTGASTIADVDIRSNYGLHVRPTDGNVDNTNIYLGGSRTNQRKCAIIFDPAGGWCRGDLHFCMDNAGDLSDVEKNDSKMVIKAGGKIAMHTQSPMNRFQVGGHTFDGGHGMYNNDRVGMSNHGALTGLMLASTYDDANHPEYGVVFVQGPTTSSYNVWSISPDGPAKGNSLNLHYGAQATNIHSPGNQKFEFTGDGEFLAPYTPSFCARGNTTHTNPQNPVDYTDEIFDVGGNYDPTAGTSAFTAPVTGKYFFHATAMFSSNFTNFNYIFMDFVYDGTTTGRERMMPRPSGGSYATIENSGIFHMVAGKTMQVRVNQDGGTNATIRNAYRFFEGYLIG